MFVTPDCVNIVSIMFQLAPLAFARNGLVRLCAVHVTQISRYFFIVACANQIQVQLLNVIVSRMELFGGLVNICLRNRFGDHHFIEVFGSWTRSSVAFGFIFRFVYYLVLWPLFLSVQILIGRYIRLGAHQLNHLPREKYYLLELAWNAWHQHKWVVWSRPKPDRENNWRRNGNEMRELCVAQSYI